MLNHCNSIHRVPSLLRGPFCLMYKYRLNRWREMKIKKNNVIRNIAIVFAENTGREHVPFYRRYVAAAKTFLPAGSAERHLRVSPIACRRGLPCFHLHCRRSSRRRLDSLSAAETCRRDAGKCAVCGADSRWSRRHPPGTATGDVSRRKRRRSAGPLLLMSESASWVRAAIPSWFADARNDRPETRTRVIIIHTSFGRI